MATDAPSREAMATFLGAGGSEGGKAGEGGAGTRIASPLPPHMPHVELSVRIRLNGGVPSAAGPSARKKANRINAFRKANRPGTDRWRWVGRTPVIGRRLRTVCVNPCRSTRRREADGGSVKPLMYVPAAQRVAHFFLIV